MSGEAANNLTTDPNASQDPPPADPPSDPPADPPTDPPVGDDPPADPPSGDDPSEGEEGGKGESRFTRDIRRLKAENKEAQAREQAIREYAEFWRGRALGGKPPESEPEQDKPAPKLSDYKGDTDKWAEAYAAWNDERTEKRAAKVVETQLSKAKETESTQQVHNKWNERLGKFAEQHEDAMDVIGDKTFTQSPTMSKVIMASERGPELAYHLSKNRSENERIKQLPPEMQAAELGRIESKLATGKPPPKPPKEPPNPVRGGGSPSIDLEKCSMEEYLAHRIPGYGKK